MLKTCVCIKPIRGCKKFVKYKAAKEKYWNVIIVEIYGYRGFFREFYEDEFNEHFIIVNPGDAG